jgi:hypothetical protein
MLRVPLLLTVWHSWPMEERDLPLQQILSIFAYVVYSPDEGIIAEAMMATSAVRALAAHLAKNRDSNAALYKREPAGWTMF